MVRACDARSVAFTRADEASKAKDLRALEMWGRVWLALLASSGPLGTDEDMDTALYGSVEDIECAMYG